MGSGCTGIEDHEDMNRDSLELDVGMKIHYKIHIYLKQDLPHAHQSNFKVTFGDPQPSPSDVKNVIIQSKSNTPLSIPRFRYPGYQPRISTLPIFKMPTILGSLTSRLSYHLLSSHTTSPNKINKIISHVPKS
jgi:hypothetical protein